ncbi:MAG: hypothetical protein Q7S22_08895 [Candidatus Micrarchaeota archaeon]|nr:hypothetical protein [Candidatus Micrarchaeota archaeon]
MAVAQIHGKELVKVCVRGQLKNLVVLRGFELTNPFNAHPLVDKFNQENGTSLKVVSHTAADSALTIGETWRNFTSGPSTFVSPFVVDTLIAHEGCHTTLGKEIVSYVHGQRVVLVTGKYQGERDVALVALGMNLIDFKKDGDSVILDISDDRLTLVPKFPTEAGWYMPYAETGVPCGEKVAKSSSARYLHKYDDPSHAYVSLLVRVAQIYDNMRCGVYALRRFARYELVAEVPDVDVPKITSLIESVHGRWEHADDV